MKPTKRLELVAALEFDSDEDVTRVDLQNGCVVSVECALHRALAAGDAETWPDQPDWQKAELEIARAFAGRLVPQNPTDEPAEKLLERVQTSRLGGKKINEEGYERTTA